MSMKLISLLFLVACADQPKRYSCTATATCNGSSSTETLAADEIHAMWSEESAWVTECTDACPGADVKIDSQSIAANSCVMVCGENL